MTINKKTCNFKRLFFFEDNLYYFAKMNLCVEQLLTQTRENKNIVCPMCKKGLYVLNKKYHQNSYLQMIQHHNAYFKMMYSYEK